MKQDRYNLENQLILLFEKHNANKNIIEKVKDFMMDRGFSSGEVMRTINKQVTMDSLSDVELYLYTKIFFEITKNEDLNPETYFTPSEIVKAEGYKKIKEIVDDVIVIHNVFQTADNQYVCPMVSYADLAKWHTNHLLTYNHETQRQMTKISIGNQIITRATLNQKAVNSMTELMLKDKFTPNMLAFNIRRTGYEQFEYDAKGKTLTILLDDKTFIDVVDGYHRLTAILNTMVRKPDLERYISINMLHYTETEAQEFIYQEDQRTPISKEHLNLYNTSDVIMEMLKDINKQQSINELFNKIAKEDYEIEKEDKYVTFSVLRDAIDFNFKFDKENNRTVRKTKNFIIDGFNEIIGYIKDKYKDREDQYYVLQSNMFIGYVALLSQLQEVNRWEDKIETVMDSINFRKDNDDWKEIGITNKNINKGLIRKISNYFVEAIKNVSEVKENV